MRRIVVADLLIMFILLVVIAAGVAQGLSEEAPAAVLTFAPITAVKNWWIPPLNTGWQWQLTGAVDQSYDVDMYDIDMFNNDASVVASLHAKGRKVIGYISAGSWERWRPDAGEFPEEVMGRPLEGWQGERWLDTRRIDILGPIMTARMELCKEKGFDGIEPDNIDGYVNDTGFSLTYQDQINHNIFLANEAHARGLSI